MSTVTMEEVQAELPALLERLAEGEELVIVREGQPVGRLLPALPKGVPIYGRGQGKVIVAADDDDHLDEFAEYIS